MQEGFRKEFLPLVSKSSWIITWLINIFGGAVLLVMLIMLAVFPFLISGDIKVIVIVAVLYYPVWAIGIYRFFRYVKKSRSKSVTKIIVDDKGIHFYKKDGNIDSILYIQLGPSRHSDDYEVYLTRQRKTWILVVGITRNETKVVFDGTDVGSTHYIKNGRALRARFIEGIVRFRPDLKIDPFVFKEFSIHPEKFTFDGKRYLKHVGEAAIITGIIVLLSFGLILLVVKV